MIFDLLTRLSSAQQITADAVSTNDYDTGNVTPKRNIAVGEPLAIVMCITAVGTNTGSAKVQAIQSATAGLGSGTVILGEHDIPAAKLVAGTIVIVPFGQGAAPLRYVGANYDITGTVDFTVDTYIVPLSGASIIAASYAKGYAV